LKQKAVGKELTHGFGFLPEIPVTPHAVDKPHPSSTTNTSSCFAVGFLGNRASVLLYTDWKIPYARLFPLVKGKSHKTVSTSLLDVSWNGLVGWRHRSEKKYPDP
jgi:hypothetical protein